MANSTFSKAVETWNVRNLGQTLTVKTDRVLVQKIVVRDDKGKFHGATNFRVNGQTAAQ